MMIRVFALVLCVSPAAAATISFTAAPSGAVRFDAPPASVAVCNLDGDAHADLAVVTRDARLHLLRGRGDGSFAPFESGSVAVLADPHLVACGDVDGDGATDVAVTSHDSNEAFVVFGAVANDRATGRLRLFDGDDGHNHGLSIADLDGDGFDDVAAGHQDRDEIVILYGAPKGDGLVRAAIPAGRAPYVHTARAGGSSSLVVVPNIGGSAAKELAIDGARRVQSRTHRLDPRPYFATTGNIDGEGRDDLIFTHDDSTIVSIVMRTTDRSRVVRFDAGTRGWKVAAADFDGDGRDDLAVAGGGTVRIFRSNGRSGFERAATLDAGRGSWEVVSADLDGDGLADLVVPSTTDRSIAVFLTRSKR